MRNKNTDDASSELRRVKLSRPIFKKLLSLLNTFFLILLGVFLILRFFFLTSYVINSGSMRPALQHDDHVLAWRYYPGFSPSLKRGEILIFQLPSDSSALVKRLIGLPGEEVVINQQGVRINGSLLPEPYLSSVPGKDTEARFSIPEGKVLVLGDNRLNSRDSREFGLVDREWIQGRVWSIFLPFSRFHLLSLS